MSMPESDSTGIHSIIEILDQFLSKPPPEKWGNRSWIGIAELFNTTAQHDYWFSLGQMNNSTEVLDWIIQLHEEKWATPEYIGKLVAALDEHL